MAYFHKSGWWSAAALVLGGLSAPLITLVWMGLGNSLFAGSGILMRILVALGIGVLLGPFLSSFLLTILIPQAYDWSLSSGNAIACALFAANELAAGGERATGGVLVLPVSAVVWIMGYVGVVVARRFGPSRCREPRHTPAGEPQCPGCGYVLYHAKDRTCPECGRPFTLLEIDLRRAQWDGFVLKPREPRMLEAIEALEDLGRSTGTQ